MLDLAYLIAAILYLPVLLVRMVFTGKYRTGWRQRFGHIKPRVGTKPCIWIHGVSLGEINATRSLVAEIERRMPRYDLVISTTTNTGFEAATKQYSPRLVFRYPGAVGAFAGHLLLGHAVQLVENSAPELLGGLAIAIGGVGDKSRDSLLIDRAQPQDP